MDLTGEAEFETGLHSSLTCSRRSLSSLYLSDLLYFFLYISLSFLFGLPPSLLLLFLSLSSPLPFQSTTAATVPVPALKKTKIVCSGLKFHTYKTDIVAEPRGD